MTIERAALVAGACVALLATGCGDDGGSTSSFTGPDPATLTPADAPLFAEAVVRPEGDQREEADAALSKLLATDDPGGFIVKRLDRALAEEAEGFTYEDDVAPWLGSRAGVFFESFSEDADAAAAVLTVTDQAAARDAIDKASAADRKPERRASYEGVDYTASRDGTAIGLVGDFLVTGSENAFKDAVDAERGSSLAESSEFASQLDAQPDHQLAFVYVEPQEVVDALERSGELTAGEVDSADPQLKDLLSKPATMSLSATADELLLEVSAAESEATQSTEGSPLLSDFPGDSWFAFAGSDAGSTLAQAFDAAAERSLGLFDFGSQLDGWAKDVGGFARGTSLFGLGGALVVETDDEEASAATLDDLKRALSGDPSVRISPLSADGEQGFTLSPSDQPIQIQFVQKDDKVVVGLGSESVDQVYSPSSTLGDSDAFQAARDALGDFPPVAFIDFVPLFQLLESFQQVSEDPDYQRAKPYLDHLDSLVVGGRSDGGRASVRIVLGLREASSETSGVEAANAAVVP